MGDIAAQAAEYKQLASATKDRHILDLVIALDERLDKIERTVRSVDGALSDMLFGPR